MAALDAHRMTWCGIQVLGVNRGDNGAFPAFESALRR
jgi:hypothetical protein